MAHSGGIDDMPTETMRRANVFIIEIEQMVKDELAMLEKFYVSDHQDVPFERAINKAKRKFEKRRGPTLIKPLNKKKNRMVVGEMEFDPVAQLWKGNDSDLVSFPRSSAPALITNLGRNEERVVGNMKWDPKQKEWRGNEADLSKFRSLKPGLITQLNSNYNTRVENGMYLDPISMKWRGNEDDLDESETEHAKLIGWFPEDRDLDDREHLYSIRQMSIMKLIKNTTRQYNQESASATGQAIGFGGGVLPLILNTKKPVLDETNEWDDVDFDEQPTLKLNLKVHQDAADEEDDSSQWDKEMGFTSEDDEDESWGDFGGTIDGTLSGKLDKYKENKDSSDDMDWSVGLDKSIKKTPSASSLKNIFGGNIKALNQIERGGSISVKRGGTLNNIPPLSTSSSATNTPLSVSSCTTPIMPSEEFDDVDIPNGPLQLKPREHSDDFDTLDRESSSVSASRLSPVERDVVEEEWPDVHVPSDLGIKRPTAEVASRRSPPVNKQVEDYSDEIDLPVNNQPLHLKQHLLIDNPFGDGDSSDEGWDDISFPENFKASTPVQAAQPHPLIQNLTSLNKSNNKINNISNISNISNINQISNNAFSTPTHTRSSSHAAMTMSIDDSDDDFDGPSTPNASWNKSIKPTSQDSPNSPFTPLSPTSVQELLRPPPPSTTPVKPLDLLKRNNTNPY
eukprot:gene2640-3045_t